MQTTSHLLMIRPVDFKFNLQTAVNNMFQRQSDDLDVQKKALQEFDDFVALLRENDVDVTVVDDTKDRETPDSIFPNNWVSFHEDGSAFLYPMYSENRRHERRTDILEKLRLKFVLDEVVDLSRYERENVYLEGTGSMVLDRKNKITYACLSPRTNELVIQDFCSKTNYSAVIFKAADQKGFPIYHTNVMMCIGDDFAVVCFESISDSKDADKVRRSLVESNKIIIEIDLQQMNHFAGNMLQIKNASGESLLVMSQQAYHSLSSLQVGLLEKHCKIIHTPLDTIESHGGGSARCMLAEIHLPPR